MKTQVWIAVSVYILVAIMRKELGIDLSLSQLLQILSVNIFEQVPINEIVAKSALQNKSPNLRNQLEFNMF